jgi:superfamily I DNA/RNA helicase
MTVLTRTRADYEKSLIRLTPEQKKILEQIHLDSDFLVKGAAGTGKTLILLKAIEKAKGRGAQAGFALDELTGSAALLTYTNTLVKYDRYIASILSGGNGADRIMTADSFIRERLAAIDPGATMDYDITKQLAERYAPEGIEAKDILAEAEGFIWANDVSYEEYALGMMERRGMKHPLLQDDRRKVWAACESMAAEMAASRRYGKGYSRVRLIRHAESNRDDPALKVVDYVFVDEAQDLSASDLKALKACSRRALILAGDADQSIYQPGFSFRRAGIDISGRTRILKLNFRNTVAIHELAERFRAAVPGFDPDNEPAAFRDGAAPELFYATNRQELLDILVARVDLFVGRLGYDPDNVAVLVPLVDDIEFVRERLVSKGYAVADLRDKSFDFSSPGAVRVSTLHSAKGLDFPVVLLFLYRPPYFGSAFDEMTTDKMTRNLVYVAMTRAMDHLGIFTLEEPKSQALKDLRDSFELKPSGVS